MILLCSPAPLRWVKGLERCDAKSAVSHSGRVSLVLEQSKAAVRLPSKGSPASSCVPRAGSGMGVTCQGCGLSESCCSNFLAAGSQKAVRNRLDGSSGTMQRIRRRVWGLVDSVTASAIIHSLFSGIALPRTSVSPSVKWENTDLLPWAVVWLWEF